MFSQSIPAYRPGFPLCTFLLLLWWDAPAFRTRVCSKRCSRRMSEPRSLSSSIEMVDRGSMPAEKQRRTTIVTPKRSPFGWWCILHYGWMVRNTTRLRCTVGGKWGNMVTLIRLVLPLSHRKTWSMHLLVKSSCGHPADAGESQVVALRFWILVPAAAGCAEGPPPLQTLFLHLHVDHLLVIFSPLCRLTPCSSPR